MPEEQPQHDQARLSALPKRKRRAASVYDAVAGRIGLNGFLGPEQLATSSARPLAPEEVILNSINAPNQPLDQWYSVELDGGDSDQQLPDSDVLKAVHTYASDFYDRTTHTRGQHDYRSMDGTALIAIGLLLEEVCQQALGETGDMVLVEPRGLDSGLPESQRTKHQVNGKVKPPTTPQHDSAASDTDSEEVRPKKRRV